MALARVKVWIPGDVLTASDLNGEFNNILNNPITLISPTTGVITFSTAQTFPLQQIVTSSAGVAVTAAPSRVSGLRGTLSSQSATFSADSYVMRSSNGVQSWTVSATSSYTVSIATAGPAENGRDVAGSFASTYVHWYAISTGAGSTSIQGLVSSTPPPLGPAAMPTSYKGWSYLGGSIYSSNSTAVAQDHAFAGAWSYYLIPPATVSVGASTSFTQVGYGTQAPTNSLAAQFALNIYSQNASAITQNLEIGFTSTNAAFQSVQVLGGNLTEGLANISLIMPASTGTNPLLTYKFTSTATTKTLNASLQGYKMPNGDA